MSLVQALRSQDPIMWRNRLRYIFVALVRGDPQAHPTGIMGGFQQMHAYPDAITMLDLYCEMLRTGSN